MTVKLRRIIAKNGFLSTLAAGLEAFVVVVAVTVIRKSH